MPVAFVAAYEKGSNVDKDYYVNKHIPLVTSTCKCPGTGPFLPFLEKKDCLLIYVWGTSGNDPAMKRWTAATSLDENDPYEAVFQAVFESKEALEKSLKDLGEEKNATFYEDAKKFSTKEPKVYHMEIRATSSS